MRSRNRPRHHTAPACATCDADLLHCHGTLVLHADGSAECDEAHRCGVREDIHDCWIACSELLCGCTGDEQPAPQLLLAA